MATKWDRWTFLKLVEFLLVISCFIAKKITDDEASRLFLYLQKISREWRLLNNVTWSSVGASAADAIYGGYMIITGGLFLSRLCMELPTRHRVLERFLLGLGAVLFIILGSLEYASLDSVPPDLVDNAAVTGTLTLVTALAFLLDLAGPRLKKTMQPKAKPQTIDLASVEREMMAAERRDPKPISKPISKPIISPETELEDKTKKKDQPRKEVEMNGKAKKFNIFGNDRVDSRKKADKEAKPEPKAVQEVIERVEYRQPVFSKFRGPMYGRYEDFTPNYLIAPRDLDAGLPSHPGEPGYVQYAAQKWERKSLKSRGISDV